VLTLKESIQIKMERLMYISKHHLYTEDIDYRIDFWFIDKNLDSM